MVRPNFIDMVPVDLNYYPFMISLNKCTGSCNVSLDVVMCYIQKYVLQKNKAFNMITNKNEAEAMAEHIS